MQNLERTNNVQYELYSNIFGSLIIPEPRGWENDTQGLDRERESKAILVKKEVNIEFYGKASDYIMTVFRSFGIGEKVLLTRREKDVSSLVEQWKLRYVKQLDLKTAKYDVATGKLTVKATEGGLYDDINNRKSDEYDILTNESADGKFIGELKTYNIQVSEREIFIESYLKDSLSDYRVTTHTYKESDSYVARSIPLNIVYRSGEDVIRPANSIPERNDAQNHFGISESIGSSDPVQNHFLEQSIEDKTLKIKMKLVFNISDFYKRNTIFERLTVAFRVSETDLEGASVLKSHTNLLTINNPATNKQTQIVEFEEDIEIKKGDSLAFVFGSEYGQVDDGGIFDTDTAKTVAYLNVTESWVKIQDVTRYMTSTGKCISPFDLFDRLIAKITGKNGLFRSSVFGEGGKYENFVVDNGFWARGFPDSIINENGEKERIQFKTSFEQAFKSFCYLEPLAWFVENEGNKQVLRIEPATYTMQNFIGVDLGVVDEIEHEASEPDFFSSIELGHSKSLDYEELNGLDEFNGLSKFGTHIKDNDSKYSVISDYRNDAIGYELIRRKPYLKFPKADTPRDEDIWMHDCKKIGIGLYAHNKWNDIVDGVQLFSQPPKGIFSPETAWNLRLSPMNRLRFGHGYSVKRSLYHYPDKYIRFNSSNSNQNLVTYPNGIELFEGNNEGKIQIKDIEKSKIEPERTKMSFRMTQELEDRFMGFKEINGSQVPNFFGLIRYMENGIERFGRLEKLSGNDKSQITLMNAKL